MRTRPASMDDVPVTAELVRRSDVFWFGAPEHDEGEVREFFDHTSSFDTDSVTILDGDRLVGLALRNATDSWYVTEPDANQDELNRRLIDFYAAGPKPTMQALSRDEQLRGALAARGWKHDRSMFDLVRPVDDGWTIAEPAWPGGITARELRPEDVPAVHHLIYVDAAWAEVAGHPNRAFDDWRTIFVTEHTLPEQQVLAWRGDRLAGVAMGRTFSDGTGWISQLAVAKDERGNGLGRALLLDALRRRRAGGATSLGLAVQADNRGALGLYLSCGLTIDREWMEYAPR
ncbi:MAG: GNAT family N-acetyltransferase [Jatrophihabitantaceae bacterium]